MKYFWVKVKTIYDLGFLSVFWVVLHRLKLKTSRYVTTTSQKLQNDEPFFIYFPTVIDDQKAASQTMVGKKINYFGWYDRVLENGQPPNWVMNPLTQYPLGLSHWSKLSDFDKAAGDIKLVWEASRFSWIFQWVEASVSGDASALLQLNDWLADWNRCNPTYLGPNWKCGQEAGIRVMHLAMASLLLGHVKNPSSALLDLIEFHLIRIKQTYRYALAQKNNHATSEAAALFIGGSWLARFGRSNGKTWERLGRRCLERLVCQLIEKDGSFSQYSMNYHRVMLDTLCMVTLWQRLFELPSFSTRFLEQAQAATIWLAACVNPESGDAPNLGANDGAYLYPIGRSAQQLRDFRLSVQTAAALYFDQIVYSKDGPWNDRLRAFNLSIPKTVMPLNNTYTFNDGGYLLARQGVCFLMLRYPRFHYRPSQCDLLHLDFWFGSENIFRDAGSYGYHVAQEEMDYFNGMQGHNTIQFDDREPMPKLSRFLYGNWVKTKTFNPFYEREGVLYGSAAYQDGFGAYHQREIIFSEQSLIVKDHIFGVQNKAILRWRLAPGEWTLQENGCHHPVFGRLIIECSMKNQSIRLVQGFESRYYLQKTGVPVLEVEVQEDGQLISRYEWSV